MTIRHTLIAFTFVTAFGSSAFAQQQCVPGQTPTAEQQAGRRAAVSAARFINTIENARGGRTRTYLRPADLQTEVIQQQPQAPPSSIVHKLNFGAPELMPGWVLTLEVTADGYWFSIKDTQDPCGFTIISNRDGLIYNAMPLQ
jgi:hypothetical protein